MFEPSTARADASIPIAPVLDNTRGDVRSALGKGMKSCIVIINNNPRTLQIYMTKNRIIGILAILIVYFGLILMTAMFAAIGLVEEIPVWSLPLFAIGSIGMAISVG